MSWCKKVNGSDYTMNMLRRKTSCKNYALSDFTYSGGQFEHAFIYTDQVADAHYWYIVLNVVLPYCKYRHKFWTITQKWQDISQTCIFWNQTKTKTVFITADCLCLRFLGIGNAISVRSVLGLSFQIYIRLGNNGKNVKWNKSTIFHSPECRITHTKPLLSLLITRLCFSFWMNQTGTFPSLSISLFILLFFSNHVNIFSFKWTDIDGNVPS